ncbi:MAG TPA: BON domain-containing protein [Terriglobales bacterium]|jgi:hyperosmotically inducible protein|nr:BON domain-containing protein [Terriglobales bacterium]
MRNVRLLSVVLVLALAVAVGCSTKQAGTQSVKDNVTKSLEQAGLKQIDVKEDRDKKVITLSGNVESEDEKNRAAEMAKSAAPGWVVANEIGVRPQGVESEAREVSSNLDDAIENNFKAALVANRLDDQHIRYDAKNGVLTLEGDVDTTQQRRMIEKLAASVPNVTQVVNKLEVKRARK